MPELSHCQGNTFVSPRVAFGCVFTKANSPATTTAFTLTKPRLSANPARFITAPPHDTDMALTSPATNIGLIILFIVLFIGVVAWKGKALVTIFAHALFQGRKRRQEEQAAANETTDV